MSRGKIAVALSGGVDSLYAFLKLRLQGWDTVPLHAVFCGAPGWSAKAEILAGICRKLDSELTVLDLRGQFEKLVIEPFRRDYLRGLTPNPCSWCNRLVKFGLLKEAALALGADYFATGHYARLIPNPYAAGAASLLAPPADCGKDQSYFLGIVSPGHLENVIFPLAWEKKREIKARLEAMGVEPVEEGESRDICFLAARGKARFFAASAEGGQRGAILLRDSISGAERQIGWHNGLENHTPGQRRGLGIAWREPLYVVELRGDANEVVVAEKKIAVTRQLDVEPLNFFVPFSHWPARIRVRLRYRGKLAETAVEERGGRLRCLFKAEQNPAAPGQIAVFYDDNGLVLCAGVAMGNVP